MWDIYVFYHLIASSNAWRARSMAVKDIGRQLIHLLALKLWTGERIERDSRETFEGNHGKWDDNELEEEEYIFWFRYWRMHLLWHNIDVMHVKKTIYNMLLENIKGKIRNTLNWKCKLMRMKASKELHYIHKGENRYELTPPCFTLTSSYKHHFIETQ